MEYLFVFGAGALVMLCGVVVVWAYKVSRGLARGDLPAAPPPPPPLPSSTTRPGPGALEPVDRVEQIHDEAFDALHDHLDRGPADDIGARLDGAFADYPLPGDADDTDGDL